MHSEKLKTSKYFTPFQIIIISFVTIISTILIGFIISTIFNWKNENSSATTQEDNENDYFQANIDENIASTAVILAYNQQLYYSLPNLISNDKCLGEKLGETCGWKAKKDKAGNELVSNGMAQNTSKGNGIYRNQNTADILFIKGGDNVIPLFNLSEYNKFKELSLDKIIATRGSYSIQFLNSHNDDSIKLDKKATQDLLMGLLPIKQYYKIYGDDHIQGKALLQISNDVEYICRWEFSEYVNSLVLFESTDDYVDDQSPQVTYMCTTQPIIDNFG